MAASARHERVAAAFIMTPADIESMPIDDISDAAFGARINAAFGMLVADVAQAREDGASVRQFLISFHHGINAAISSVAMPCIKWARWLIR